MQTPITKQVYLYYYQTKEQLCTKPLWPLNKGTVTKYKVILWKPKQIYRRALINKQENRQKEEKKM